MSESCGCGGVRRQNPAAMTKVTCRIVENVLVARDTYRMRLASMGLMPIARGVVPGQFVMIRVPGSVDPLLGRAFAIYDAGFDGDGNTDGGQAWLDVVYLRVGRATTGFTQLVSGMPMELWGPLGNGFPHFDPAECDHLIGVAGGIGQTPMRLLIAESLGLRRFTRTTAAETTAEADGNISRVSLCYGARDAAGLAEVSAFAATGAEMFVATEDGSAGEKGRVTAPLERLLREKTTVERRRTCVTACGPSPMLIAVQRLLREYDTPGWLSLETPMACGMGICFSCVTKIRMAVPPAAGSAEKSANTAETWDYRRTCVDGPVFDSQSVIFESVE